MIFILIFLFFCIRSTVPRHKIESFVDIIWKYSIVSIVCFLLLLISVLF